LTRRKGTEKRGHNYAKKELKKAKKRTRKNVRRI
jgi:hypothetical protein